LIELGFINKEEGEYLDSEAGQEQMALQIAIKLYNIKKYILGLMLR
jgi:N-acetylmuramoyl-L-alanine amidase